MDRDVAALKTEDIALYEELLEINPRPRRRDQLVFEDPILEQPKAAPVLIYRLQGDQDSPPVKRAIAEALPYTSGDWQEGAAYLIGKEASPEVRAALVESMRFAQYPHTINGIRLGLRDKDAQVRASAARTAGFVPNGKVLWGDLKSALFDSATWDVRASAAQSLGQLKVVEAWAALLRALKDPKKEVRFRSLQALIKIDSNRAAGAPEVAALLTDKDHRTRGLAGQLLGKEVKPRKLPKKRAKSPAPSPTPAPAPAPG